MNNAIMKTLWFMLGLLLLPFCQAQAECPSRKETFVEGAFRYVIFDDTADVRISDVADTIPLPVTPDSTLVIPASVMHNGKCWHVTGIRRYTFTCRPEVKHLVISEGVEMLEERTFGACYNLESVSIPSTMEIIDENAFYDCPRLRSMSVADGNEYFDSRDGCNAVINKAGNYLQLGCSGTNIPHSIDSIGDNAFSGCTGMESVIIPEGIKTICHEAFSSCIRLKEVSFPKSLRKLQAGSFSTCISLDSVFIPRGVRKIGNNPFASCPRLRRIVVDGKNKWYDSRNDCNAIIHTASNKMQSACASSSIPESVDSIGHEAFAGTTLASIHIPKNVIRINSEAFANCIYCSSITVDEGNPVYDSRNGCNAVIEKSTNTLVLGCGRTVVPCDVKVIGCGAFSGMTLPSVFHIPEGVERVEGLAFFSCVNLQKVILPHSLRNIECNAFCFCKNLTTVRILSQETKTEGLSFSDCENLKYVELPPDLSEISCYTFYECPYEETWMSIRKQRGLNYYRIPLRYRDF